MRRLVIFSLLMTVMVGSREAFPDPALSAENLLPPCSGSPNCVSSLAPQPSRRVGPLSIIDTPDESLQRLEKIIRSMRGAVIVSRTERMLQAEFRTRLGFVDDVLFVVSEVEDVFHVRSASRTGYWDLGVNRRRVERIREKYEGVER